MRRGWTRNSMKLDVVTVTGHRAKNNPHVKRDYGGARGRQKLFAGSSSENERRPRRRNDFALLLHASMTAWLKRTLLACAVVVAAQPAFAQWPTYASKSIPHKRDGTVNLDAPAPRPKDGHRLVGIVRTSRAQRHQSRFRRAAVEGRRPPAATFWNLGAGVQNGLPFRPLAGSYAPSAWQTTKNSPDAHCLPMGLMQLHLHPQPRKLVQTPAVIVIMYEGNQGLRRSSRTAAGSRAERDLQPWWWLFGRSLEGDTLVVETVGFRDDVWLDVRKPLTTPPE
jgi:hypothetical protein